MAENNNFNASANQIIFPGVVYDSVDELMLGRLRVLPEGKKYSEIIPENFNESKDAWTSNDPILFIPLLPFHINVNAQKGELVYLLYQNKDFPGQNQYYLPGPISSPMASIYEYNAAAKKDTAMGDRIKSSLKLLTKNKEYFKKESYGVFPEAKDNAFLGRGTTDIILKEDDVLIRAGKVKTLNKEILPVGNVNRAFIQLSRFTSKKIELPPETQIRMTEDVKVVKKMIVWNITTLENEQDKFTGDITLRSVKPSENVNTTNFNNSTILNLSEGTDYGLPLESESFSALDFDSCIEIMNNFINGVLTSFKDYKGKVNNINNASVDTTFPLVVTPSQLTLKTAKDLLTSTSNPTKQDSVEFQNYLRFMSKITTGPSSAKSGFFKVWGLKNGIPVFNPPPGLKKQEVKKYKYEVNEDVTYATMGGQKIYLLSHDSDGPKGKISLSETLYGIPQDKFIGGSTNSSILDKTYPTVRGDKLMELITKIVSFLAGHVHPIASVPPTPVSTGSGQSIQEIFQLVADAENTILNENIRIN
jgi:hypothetical protein